MKYAASMPALSRMDQQTGGTGSPYRAEKAHLLKRAMTLSDLQRSSQGLEIRREIFNTPFLAMPGVGLQLRTMSRTFSRKLLSGLDGYESFADSDKKSTSSPGSEGEFPWPELDEKFTGALVRAVAIVSLSAFQVGYNTGVINVPEKIIRSSLEPGTTMTDIQWAAIVSTFCIGGLLGSYVAGSLADAWGRKKFLLLNNLSFLIGGAMELFANSFYSLVVARLILGWGCGGVTVVVPLYLGELAPAVLRGTVGTMHQFLMVIGILIANLLGKPLGTDTTWRHLLGTITLLPAIIQSLAGPLLPESPRWLIMKGRKQEGTDVLRELRAAPALKIELDPVGEAKANAPAGTPPVAPTFWSLVSRSDMRFPLTIGLGLQLAQQFSGVNAVFYYSSSFFERAHVDDPWLGSVLASGVNVLATALAVHLMDRSGRRRLLLSSSIGMFFATMILTVALFLAAASPSSVILGYISVGAVLLFVIFFEIGLGPIPWLITAEIFPPEVSATAMTATCSLNWIANFIVGITFPMMNRSLANFTFIPFGLVCLATFILTLWYIPETKGKSLEEIQAELRGESPLAHDSDEEAAARFGSAIAAAGGLGGTRNRRADSEDDFGGLGGGDEEEAGVRAAIGQSIGGMARSLYESTAAAAGGNAQQATLDMASVDDYLNGGGNDRHERSDSD